MRSSRRWRCGRWRACSRSAGSGRTLAGREYRPGACPAEDARRNVHAAVGIFDIEDHGVAADFAPVADDADSVVAGGHDACEVDGATSSLWPRECLSTMGAERIPGMVICSPPLVCLRSGCHLRGDGFGELRGSEVCSPLQIMYGQPLGCFLRASRCRSRCRERRRWSEGMPRALQCWQSVALTGFSCALVRLQRPLPATACALCGCAASAEESLGLSRMAAPPNRRQKQQQS